MNDLQFEQYYRNNFEALSSFAMKLARNKMDADDLIQETAIKAYRSFHKFIEGSSFKNWTFTILKNTFLTKYKKKKKAKLVSLSFEDMEYAAVLPKEIELDIKPSSTLANLSKCIENLSEKSREPFVMYINGYQYSEISQCLEIPIGTVKSRINFARTKLKGMLHTHRAIAS